MRKFNKTKLLELDLGDVLNLLQAILEWCSEHPGHTMWEAVSESRHKLGASITEADGGPI